MTESANSRQSEQYAQVDRLGDELRGERATLGKSLLDVQRDIKIKAEYLAAIENADLSVFPNKSFIAGYVRSYARYLRIDPDDAYRRFCAESGFVGVNSGIARPPQAAPGRAAAAAGRGGFRPDFPLGAPRRRLPHIPFGAIGSVLLLVMLIGVLGYGGWAVLQNIQRVHFAPVEEVPVALAEVQPLEPPAAAAEPGVPDLATPVAATALVDLYRQQELEVPILVPRDGPIAAIDPDRIGLLATARPETAVVAGMGDLAPVPDLSGAEPQLTEPDARPRLTVIAERPAWIRVYFADGTVIFERILESGEVYEVPETEEPALIWAGNSGSVYIRIDEALHGPLGPGTRATRDVTLEAAALSERYDVVADIPSVISDALGTIAGSAGVLVQ